MNQIDAILYINLEHRTDRDEHIRCEIHKLCDDESKIHRINAIKRDPGALGCGLSHIKALEYAQSHPEWKTILILEDDFTFGDFTMLELNRYLSHIVTLESYDIGLLSYNAHEFRGGDVSDPLLKKVLYSQTTSSYLISSHYIPTLLQNFTESTTDIQRHGVRHENCIDIYWTRLQPSGNWYALYPAIGYQYENYSDIERKVTNYHC